MELETGPVTIKLRPDLAPQHVARIKELAREGFYDGVVFHRVIAGFMAQGGDPTGTGTSGSSKPNLPAEFSREPHVRGVCSMARTSRSELGQQPVLYLLRRCAFPGQANTQSGAWSTEGMEAIDALPKGEPPRAPGKIVSMKVAADA